MLHYHNHHHHQHFLPSLIKCTDGCFSTAWSRQRTFSDSRDFSYSHSHSDASISRIFRLVTIRQLSIHGNVGASFWWRGVLPHTNQLGLGKRCWNPVVEYSHTAYGCGYSNSSLFSESGYLYFNFTQFVLKSKIPDQLTVSWYIVSKSNSHQKYIIVSFSNYDFIHF